MERSSGEPRNWTGRLKGEAASGNYVKRLIDMVEVVLEGGGPRELERRGFRPTGSELRFVRELLRRSRGEGEVERRLRSLFEF